MPSIKLRNVLAVTLVAVGFVGNTARLGAEVAEVVLTNANIYTIDAKNSRATALAIANGKFLAVGNEEQIRQHVGPKTRSVDLQGKTVVPGFIDAHAHPSPLFPEDRLWAIVELGPAAVPNLEALVQVLRRKAAKTPKGAWILGRGYSDTTLGRHPTRQDLDRVSNEHPILITHSSGHVKACNSYALNMAKLDRNTPDPRGGELERDARGELTGVLKEAPASSLVSRAGPELPEAPREEVVEGYRLRFREFFRKGITSIHVAGTSPSTADLMSAAVNDAVPMHLSIMLRENYLEEAVRRTTRKEPANPRVRYGQIKFFHGNSLSGRTCWLSKPYVDRPDYFGIAPARPQTRLNELVLRIHKAGLQSCIHANGDREIDMVLIAYENALREQPRSDHRHRIEHCSVVTAELLQRIKKLQLVIAPHSYEFEHGDKMEAYGESRWDWMHANRSMIDSGIPVAGNSDYPVSAADPLLRIQSMVTRRCQANGKVYGPKQRTTVEQALTVWTRGGAFACFEEAKRGSIEAGKQADFVVLSADPGRVDPEKIRTISVETTAVAGQVVAGTTPW